MVDFLALVGKYCLLALFDLPRIIQAKKKIRIVYTGLMSFAFIVGLIQLLSIRILPPSKIIGEIIRKVLGI